MTDKLFSCSEEKYLGNGFWTKSFDEINGRFTVKGKYRVKSSNGYEIEFDNMIVNGGLTNLAALLAGSGHTVGYLALGNDSSDVSTTDSALGNEIFRTAVTAIAPSGYSCNSTFNVLNTEAVGTIEEIGIYAGGSDAPNSGTLISRALWHYEKSDSEDLYITRIDTIGRA